MKCPTDDTQLVMSERSGIEIDYCPECRGVWLDRGELDKIVERSTAPQATASQPYRDERNSRDYGSRKKSKESWLGDLFG
jgi:Zn-finger nucleic acid-binding protein